jgi:hypothetical protein
MLITLDKEKIFNDFGVISWHIKKIDISNLDIKNIYAEYNSYEDINVISKDDKVFNIIIELNNFKRDNFTNEQNELITDNGIFNFASDLLSLNDIKLYKEVDK